MGVDGLNDALELVRRERVKRMGVLGELGGARRRLGPETGKLLAAVLLSVLL
jgi:hypothetical protein